MYDYTILNYITAEDERCINLFLESFDSFSYFQSPAFFYVCTDSKKLLPTYILAKQRDEIVGIILFYKQVQINFPVVRFFTSRAVIIGGPLVTGNNKELLDGLLGAYKKHMQKSIYTQIRNVGDTNYYNELFQEHNFRHDDHLNIIIDLTKTEEALWKDVHTKRRNEIRRAEKEGCTVDRQLSLDALQHCYKILKEVYEKAKLPLPDFSHFKAIWQYSDEKTGLRLFTATWEGQIIGCMLCLAYGNTLYDYYAGAYSQYYSKHPNDILPWEVIKWGQTNGFKRFDFGGAGKPTIQYGVREYKKKFGGELVNYGRYEVTQFPKMYRLASWSFKLGQRLLKMDYIK